jgi:ABC-type antimicrobial peptide transport system permease subunit
VSIINQRFAEQYFPNQNPVGKRFIFPGPSYSEIVGVVGDVKYHSLDEKAELDFYTDYAQSTQESLNLLLRSNANSRISVSDLRGVVRSLDPNIPLSDVRPLGDYLGRSLVARKFLLGLLTVFSVLAIFLAAIGLYAALAYSVQQRKQEIGIRVALGANSGNVLWLVLRECLTITIIGTGIGLFGAAWTTSFLKSMLYGITDTDLTAYAAAMLLTLAVALAASLAPAFRAARIDPLSALRYE